MQLPFTKMHGSGNDFVVIDATARPFRPSPDLARHLADRRLGIGCDQILVIESPSSKDVDFDYRIFNADGSESGQCGNGSRCVARFLRERGLARGDSVRVRTTTRDLALHTLPDGRVRVDMGVPLFEPGDVPFDAAARSRAYTLTLERDAMIEIGAVGMGNPHAVIAVPDAAAAAVGEIGPALQRHPAFPQSVNVGFLQVEDAGHARLRVYERGSGETLACGSGACAAAAVGQLWGMLGPRVDMQMNGGRLEIEWAGEGHPVFLTGPAVTVYRGELTWPT